MKFPFFGNIRRKKTKREVRNLDSKVKALKRKIAALRRRFNKMNLKVFTEAVEKELGRWYTFGTDEQRTAISNILSQIRGLKKTV